jgi:type III pantothenate kinase
MTVLLVADVGNTETTLALFDGERLAHRWRTTTSPVRTADECAATLVSLLASRGLARGVVSAGAIGSVVPAATPVLAAAMTTAFGIAPIVVDARSALGLRVQVDEPHAVGVDRLLNTFATHVLHRRDAIVADLGTATTFDCVTADGVFLGGIIAPGVRTSLEALVGRTSQLAATPLEAPAHAIGTNTAAAIRAGVLFGAADAIEGAIRRLRAEWPTSAVPMVLATGGLATTLAPLCPSVDMVAPDLTLHALRLAHGVLLA